MSHIEWLSADWQRTTFTAYLLVCFVSTLLIRSGRTMEARRTEDDWTYVAMGAALLFVWSVIIPWLAMMESHRQAAISLLLVIPVLGPSIWGVGLIGFAPVAVMANSLWFLFNPSRRQWQPLRMFSPYTDI